MNAVEMADLCFPPVDRWKIVDGLTVCQVCWSTVPVMDVPNRPWPATNISQSQDGHVEWHLRVEQGCAL